MLKDYNDPKHRPITAAQVREELAEKQRQEEEERQRPVREAEAQLTATHRKLIEMGREAFNKKRPDPEWLTPASALGLRMSLEKAKKFSEAEGHRFFAEFAKNPDYFHCEENVDAIDEFLSYQKPEIKTPNADCYKAAWLRLKELGLIKARPAEAPPTVEAEPQPEPVHSQPEEELTPGWDIKTGEPRNYTPREIHQMSAEQFRHAFKLYGDRGPLMRKPLL